MGSNPLGRAVDHGRREVRVHVRGGREIGVPEDAGYSPEILAGFDYGRREGVPQVMEALVGEAEPAKVPLEVARHVARVEWRALVGGEDEPAEWDDRLSRVGFTVAAHAIAGTA
jgi:hypothetical protein